MSIIWRCENISVINLRFIIRRWFFSQQLSLNAPSAAIVVPVQSNSFPDSWCATSDVEPIKPNIFCCICGEKVLKSHEGHGRNLWEDLTGCILYLRSEITIKFGCQTFAAPQEEDSWQAMDKILPIKSKISEHIWGQGERRNFCWCTHYRAIRRTQLQYKTNCYRM